MPATKTGTGTINRFLSRREKDGSSHSRQKSRDKSSDGRKKRAISQSFPAAFSTLYGKSLPLLQTTYTTIHATSANSRPGFFLQSRPLSADSILSLLKPDPQKKIDKEQATKVESIQKRLIDEGFTGVEDSHIQYTLASKHAAGDADKAFELLVLFQESVEGVIKPYDPAIHMYGAENRDGVTCYLDSLLFAMFARLGSFEPILYATFEDEPRRRLSTLIRLWVNMLRTGKLIQTDITQHLQDALAACGWKEAADIAQQDTSEAFSFITAQLQLPLLTLKMDIYHTGLEDDKDDHKFIHERLLEVAVPEDNKDGRAVQLEDCLEEYFNNRIEVVRRLERSNTLTSVRSGYTPDPEKAGSVQHVEVSELDWSSPNTPVSAPNPVSPVLPSPTLRHRSESIIRHRIIPEEEEETGEASTPTDQNTRTESTPGLTRQSSIRKGAVRKEVLMPAWQFFNLIPWYTKESPANDAEVAAHFSQTRPVLGICLKRYYMDIRGKAQKRNTFIDIPLDIRLPHFVPDEMMPDDGPLMGNFKLSLQSVICHRGNDVNSGHYISFIRGTSSSDGDSTSSRRLSTSSRPPTYAEERWIKFDDCATPRVTPYDIEKALKEETPYLLFYQVIPAYDTMPHEPETEPPSYTDSGISMTIDQCSPLPKEKEAQVGYFDGAKDDAEQSDRFSTDLERPSRTSLSLPDDRRGSVATEATVSSGLRTDGISAPVTPSEETTAQRMSRAAARFTKSGSKSRPTSQSGENRISATFSRLALMRSKESLNKVSMVKDFTMTSNDITTPRKSNSLEEMFEKPSSEATPKKNKSHKRDKSKSSMEKLEREHHHSSKGKGKDKDVPDRECQVM